jgi:hypothetical protein
MFDWFPEHGEKSGARAGRQREKTLAEAQDYSHVIHNVND